MIQVMKELPSNVIGFKAIGDVTKDDFENIIIPEVKRQVEKTGKLNYLLELDTSLKKFTPGAWFQDAYLGIKHLLDWNRAAIITDVQAIRTFTDYFSIVVPGEFKGFSYAQRQEAIDWVAEKQVD